jgi:agmatine deiminase
MQRQFDYFNQLLLNPNRNPHLSQEQVETYLRNYYGVEQILWVEDGIVGDDTDGHIDDTVRFVNEDTVLTVIEENKADENYELLAKKSSATTANALTKREAIEYC